MLTAQGLLVPPAGRMWDHKFLSHWSSGTPAPPPSRYVPFGQVGLPMLTTPEPILWSDLGSKLFSTPSGTQMAQASTKGPVPVWVLYAVTSQERSWSP